MIRVCIESPFAGRDGLKDQLLNQEYLHQSMIDSMRRGEAPFASHALYTRVLDDSKPDERRMGMAAGFEWQAVAELVVIYADRGISRGMHEGAQRAVRAGLPVELRHLDGWLDDHPGDLIRQGEVQALADLLDL